MAENLDPNYLRVHDGKGEILDVRRYNSTQFHNFKILTYVTISVCAVLVWFEEDHHLVAFIGASDKDDPVQDAVHVAHWGNWLEPAAARGIWPHKTEGKRFKGEA